MFRYNCRKKIRLKNNGIRNLRKTRFLTPPYGDAHIKNLQKLEKKETKEYVTGERLWYSPEK